MAIVTKALAASLACMLVVACAAVDPAPDLEDVRVLVSERHQPELAWDTDAAAAEAVEQRVAELLRSELTARSAVEVAFLRNRRLQGLLAEVGIAQAELVQAGLLRNPVLSAAVRVGVGASGTGVDLGLVQEFLNVLQIPLRKRVAEAELEATKLAIGAALFSLATEVRQVFFGAQAAEQKLELRRTVSQTTALASDVADRQYRAGNITDLERLNEQAFAAEARLELSEAELGVVEARENLTALLGVWGDDTAWRVVGRLSSLPAADPALAGLESLAVATRLDLAAARQEIAVASHALAFLRFYGLLPGLGGGVESEREVEGGLWSVGPAFDIELPLFDQRQAEVAIGRARRRQKEEALAALAASVRSEVRRAHARLESARRRATYFERVVLPLRATALEQTQREYNGMLVGVYQLLQAKRDQVEAGGRYVAALRDYWTARAELDRAVGTELPVEGPATDPEAPSNEKGDTPMNPGHSQHQEG